MVCRGAEEVRPIAAWTEEAQRCCGPFPVRSTSLLALPLAFPQWGKANHLLLGLLSGGDGHPLHDRDALMIRLDAWTRPAPPARSTTRCHRPGRGAWIRYGLVRA